MKRRKFIWTGLLFVPAIRAGAQFGLRSPGFVGQLSKKTGSAACTTVRDGATGAASEFDRSSGSGTLYVASKFTAGATYSACSVGMYAYKVGTLSDKSISVGIFTDSSGTPGTQLEGWSDSIAHSALPSSSAETVVALASPASISSGTAYWVVYRWQGSSSSDSSNNISVSKYNNGAATPLYYSTDAASWNLLDNNRSEKFQVYSQ